MNYSRRGLLTASLSASLCSLLASLAPAQNTGRRRPEGSQDASDDENKPPTFPPNASKTMLEERQKNIRKEVQKLYGLASELKNEVEKTDSTTILSLAMVRKAEEIEHLAKQIRDHAKG